ncbi:hypothetical protein C2I18_15415 [Paenibacillus sp. PK3_47]|nr:hypothetical protein C2I18_15415 [Paenibacillus sp. PK3_47]
MEGLTHRANRSCEASSFDFPSRDVTIIHKILIKDINHREKKRKYITIRKENDMKKIIFA